MQVSVIMPAYNAEQYISEAIESVRSQTHQDFELIIVNDGSTDNTLSIAESYAREDERIKVFSQPNIGVSITRNRAIDVALNEWIVCMDADDVMLPKRIERQLAFIERYPDVAVASSFVYYIGTDGDIIGTYRSSLTTRRAVEEQIERGELIAFHQPAVIMRKSVVQDVGGYRREVWPGEDIDLWNRIAEQGHLVLVQPEVLLKYRKHGSSTSLLKARATWLNTRWIKACAQRRRAGKPELSWDEFLAIRRRAAWWERLDQDRKDFAKVLYNVAVASFSARRYLQFAPALFGAALLQPGFTIPRVVSRFGKKDNAEPVPKLPE